MTTGRRAIELYLHETALRRIAVSQSGTNVLRIMRGRPVVLLQLAAEDAFHPDGAVFSPRADGAGLAPLTVLAAALAYHAAHPDLRLLVAGHSSTRSDARAEGVEALLARDEARWVAHAADVAGTADLQRALAWASTLGIACDPGPVDGLDGPRTQAGLAALRAARGVSATGPAGPADWRAVYGLLMQELRGRLGVEDLAALPPLVTIGPAAVGCGASWMPEDIRLGDFEPTLRDRVDLLLFAEKDLPALRCHEGGACDWKVCDVYRKGKYHVVQPELAPGPPAAAAPEAPAPPTREDVRVLLAGLLFETEKAFLLPSALTGIKALRRLYDKQHPAAVLINGHTDTVGTADFNRQLSVERAEAIAAFLRDQVEPWLAWYGADCKKDKRWGVREDKHMLAHLRDDAGAPFYAGPIDAVDWDAGTKAAVKRFQQFANARRGAGLDVDGWLGEGTRRHLIAQYMAEDATTLPPEAHVVVHGCGEFHPFVPTDDEVKEAENRRVEVLLFQGPVTPPPEDPCPGPAGCAAQPLWLQRVVRTIDVRVPLGSLEVVVLDEAGAPVAGAAVSIDGPGADAGTTGPDGRALLRDEVPGTYRVRAARDGFEPGSVETVIPSADAGPGRVELRLRPRRVLVLLPREGELPGTFVLVRDEGGFERRLSRADAAPHDAERLRLRFEGLREGGTYSLFFEHDDGLRVPFFVRVPEARLRRPGAGA